MIRFALVLASLVFIRSQFGLEYAALFLSAMIVCVLKEIRDEIEMTRELKAEGE
jgi:hypothetical protein